MGRTTYLFWVGEFVTVTAIAVILAVPQVSIWWLVAPVMGILLLKYLQHRAYIREKHFTLRQQLDLLDTILPPEDRDLRCTYHVPERRIFGQVRNLVQMIDYVPKGGGCGRKFSINKGIIGRVYQVAGQRVENFDSQDAYRARMVNEYGYSAREMEERSTDRRSYLCMAILEGGSERVVGLLYFDSRIHNTFTLDENNEVWTTIRSAVGSIRRTLIS